jgi:cytochrome c553
MHRIIVALIFFGVFIFLTTCTWKASDPSVCFSENILPIFVSKCSMSGCHSAGSTRRGDFTTYEGIMTKVVAKHPLRSEMYKKIDGNNPSMPPRGSTPLTSQEIYLIKAWISMGALNPSNCITVCDTTSFKFTEDIQPIMNTWCVGCHSTSSAGGGYDLSNYTGVVKAVTANRLMGTIKHSTGYSAMPQGGNQLSGCQISKVQNWINAGYPNN